MSQDPRRQALVSELNEAREELTGVYSELGTTLNPRERLLQSVRERPLLWTLGAFAVGYAGAGLLRGRRDSVVSTARTGGMTASLVGAAAAIIRPTVTRKIIKEAERFVSEWTQPQPPEDAPADPPASLPPGTDAEKGVASSNDSP